MRSPGRRAAACAALLAICLGGVHPAPAQQPNDAARAEALFREGKAALERRDYERACPLLASSFALDPGTGVLLALAICHEAQGKLASASADYDQVAARAAREGRADREGVARERGRALRAQASTLTIVPPPQARLPDGFAVRSDGTPLEPATFGAAVPVDGGDHVIEAAAVDRKPWQTHVRLAPTGDRRVVVIPELDFVTPRVAPAAAAVVPLSTPPPGREVAAASESSGGVSPLRVAGLALMATGAAAFGVGSYYGVRAILHNQDSNKQGCQGDTCTLEGAADRRAALAAADNATSAFVAGALSAAVGATLYLLARRAAGRGAASTALTARVDVEPGGARFLLEGTLAP